jgi:hypothetical protein
MTTIGAVDIGGTKEAGLMMRVRPLLHLIAGLRNPAIPRTPRTLT